MGAPDHSSPIDLEISMFVERMQKAGNPTRGVRKYLESVRDRMELALANLCPDGAPKWAAGAIVDAFMNCWFQKIESLLLPKTTNIDQQVLQRIAKSAKALADDLDSSRECGNRVYHAIFELVRPLRYVRGDLENNLREIAEQASNLAATLESPNLKGRPVDRSNDVFIHCMARLWSALKEEGVNVEPSLSYNNATGFRSPFYRFLSAVWHEPSMGKMPKIRAIRLAMERYPLNSDLFRAFARTVREADSQ